MNIKIYCVNGFTGNALKNKLEAALAQNQLPYQVDLINHSDDFVKDGIFSAPAIKIGEKVILYNDCSLDETAEKVVHYLRTGCDSNILVPVDFTPESIQALRYGRMMASQLGKGITVAYVHQPTLYSVSYTSGVADVIENSRKHLEKLVVDAGLDDDPSEDHVPVETYFDIGEITSTLIHLVENDKYNMIVMSSHAENSFLKRLLGSVSTLVSRLSPKPVIVVPPDAGLTFPKRIVVGLTEELLDEHALKYLVDFASEHEIFVDFAYVTHNTAKYNNLKENLTDNLLVVNKKFRKFSITSVPYVDDRIDEALTKFASEKKAGMLVVTTHHRTFVEGLGHRSVSKNILLKPVLPVMILHSRQNAEPSITDYLYDMIKEG